MFRKENPPKVKPLQYIYVALLTRIHLLRTGEVLAHLTTLAAEAKLGLVEELIRFKVDRRDGGRWMSGSSESERTKVDA